MLKIFLKAAILVFIILSIYFIVNPSACSNLMQGRVINSSEQEPAVSSGVQEHSELFTPTGDQPLTETSTYEGVYDTNTLNEPAESVYSQEDIDYAIASRYVELENEYAQNEAWGKDTAKEISYIVMDDFELTQQEWESFLHRATKNNLFDKIRSEQMAVSAK